MSKHYKRGMPHKDARILDVEAAQFRRASNRSREERVAAEQEMHMRKLHFEHKARRAAEREAMKDESGL